MQATKRAKSLMNFLVFAQCVCRSKFSRTNVAVMIANVVMKLKVSLQASFPAEDRRARWNCAWKLWLFQVHLYVIIQIGGAAKSLFAKCADMRTFKCMNLPDMIEELVAGGKSVEMITYNIHALNFFFLTMT